MGNEQKEIVGIYGGMRRQRLHRIETPLFDPEIYLSILDNKIYLTICNNGSGRSNNKLYIHAKESSLLVEYKGLGRKREDTGR